MDLFLDSLWDALGDTIICLPFLLAAYFLFIAFEFKAADKTQLAIQRAGVAGPAIGALLGAIPQCGFSAAAAMLYACRLLTLGTLFAVFLSTSDEMLPLMIAQQTELSLIVELLLLKVAIGAISGFLCDLTLRVLGIRFQGTAEIESFDDAEELPNTGSCACGCGEASWRDVVYETFVRTGQVCVFVFLITLILNLILALAGEDFLADAVAAYPTLSVLISALVGLIPNCAASVAITQLYLAGVLELGACMAGLLVAAGIGLLVLFSTNRSTRQNLTIVGLLYVIGVFWGLVITATGITF